MFEIVAISRGKDMSTDGWSKEEVANMQALGTLYKILSDHDEYVARLYARLRYTPIKANRAMEYDSLRNRLIDDILEVAGLLGKGGK
jgi:hypothetical protein